MYSKVAKKTFLNSLLSKMLNSWYLREGISDLWSLGVDYFVEIAVFDQSDPREGLINFLAH